MTSQQAELWEKLRAFEFDQKGATFTFADRLAKEHGWSADFAGRAVEEYRKFLLLVATAGHPVSPSDAVDQVWHLHLLYTRSYWDDLCRDVLERPFHHEPSAGGDHEKFDRWYRDTVASYRRILGQAPPTDVWPDPAARSEQCRHFVRTDVSSNWVLPRWRAWRTIVLIGLLLVLIALAGGCKRVSTARAGEVATLNPLDLRGPQFLAFYAVAFVVALIVAAMIRSAARGSGGWSNDRSNLDPYDIACLKGGADQAVKATIAGLAKRDLLITNPTDGTLRSVPITTANGLHPLEHAVHSAISPTLGTRLGSVRRAARHEIERIKQRLVERDLIMSDERATAVRFAGTLVALSVPVVGVVKILVGIGRDKPVGFLVIACGVSALVAVFCFTRRPHRTRRGDEVLKRLEMTYADFRAVPGELSPLDLTMAVALFGVGVLASTDLSPLHKALKRQESESGGSSFSSGCGGSGCGGSSSCGGGGGCGGGGCGGCGG